MAVDSSDQDLSYDQGYEDASSDGGGSSQVTDPLQSAVGGFSSIASSFLQGLANKQIYGSEQARQLALADAYAQRGLSPSAAINPQGTKANALTLKEFLFGKSSTGIQAGGLGIGVVAVIVVLLFVIRRR